MGGGVHSQPTATHRKGIQQCNTRNNKTLNSMRIISLNVVVGGRNVVVRTMWIIEIDLDGSVVRATD